MHNSTSQTKSAVLVSQVPKVNSPVSINCHDRMATAKKNSSLLVRLPEEDHQALRQMNETTGIKPATLATLAIRALIDYYQANEGRISLPLDFTRHRPQA